MPNNRKPKLAPGSRWEGKTIVSIHGMRYEVEGLLGSGPAVFLESLCNSMHGNPDNLLASIRAAKLDKVFDSAVALAEYWDGDLLGPAARAHFARVYPELYGLMIANSAAVKGATDG